MRRARSALLSSLMLAGCASYRFDLTAPAGVAGPVPRGDERSFPLGPFRYAVGTEDDRLSVGVYNPTDRTWRLAGNESAVVDPAGHSHPLVDQTIAPASDVRVVLPPLRPWAGGSGYAAVDARPGVYAGERDEAFAGYDRANPVYWDWPGAGTVRVQLVYRQADGERVEHDLTFDRQPAR